MTTPTKYWLSFGTPVDTYACLECAKFTAVRTPLLQLDETGVTELRAFIDCRSCGGRVVCDGEDGDNQ